MIKKIIALVFMLSFYSAHSFAIDRISIGLGKALESTYVARLGLQKDFTHSWYQTETSGLSGYWEASISYWDTDSKKEGRDITVFALSPVFVYRFKKPSYDPYIEGGVGVSRISHEKIGGRDMGGHFQFEDRLGIGARFGTQRQHDMALRFMHYSNARTQSSNDAMNMVLLVYSFKL